MLPLEPVADQKQQNGDHAQILVQVIEPQTELTKCSQSHDRNCSPSTNVPVQPSVVAVDRPASSVGRVVNADIYIQLICSYLPVATLIAAGKVNKQWNRVSSQNVVWDHAFVPTSISWEDFADNGSKNSNCNGRLLDKELTSDSTKRKFLQDKKRTKLEFAERKREQRVLKQVKRMERVFSWVQRYCVPALTFVLCFTFIVSMSVALQMGGSADWWWIWPLPVIAGVLFLSVCSACCVASACRVCTDRNSCALELAKQFQGTRFQVPYCLIFLSFITFLFLISFKLTHTISISWILTLLPLILAYCIGTAIGLFNPCSKSYLAHTIGWGASSLFVLPTLFMLGFYLDGWHTKLSIVFITFWLLDLILLVIFTFLACKRAFSQSSWRIVTVYTLFWVSFFAFRVLLVLRFDGLVSSLAYVALFVPLYAVAALTVCLC